MYWSHIIRSKDSKSTGWGPKYDSTIDQDFSLSIMSAEFKERESASARFITEETQVKSK